MHDAVVPMLQEFTAGDRKSREDAFIRADFICLRLPKVRRKGTSCRTRETRQNYVYGRHKSFVESGMKDYR